MHPINSRHSKIPLAWIVTAALIVIALSVGGTYCRLIDWSSTEVVYTPSQNTSYSSDCLVQGGQDVLLADWQPAETQRLLTIMVRRPAAEPPQTEESSSPESSSQAQSGNTDKSESAASNTASSGGAGSVPAQQKEESTGSESGEAEEVPAFDPAEVTVLLDEGAGIHLLPDVQVTQDSIELRLERRIQSLGLVEITPMSVFVRWQGLEATFRINMLPYDSPLVTQSYFTGSVQGDADPQESTAQSSASSAASSKASVSSGAAVSPKTSSSSSSAPSSAAGIASSETQSAARSDSGSSSNTQSSSSAQSGSVQESSSASAESSASNSTSSSNSTPEPESSSSVTGKHEIVTGLELLEYTPIADISAPVTAVRLNLDTQSNFTLRFHALDESGNETELKKVRYSLNGGESYTMLYDTDSISILWPYAEGWDGTVLLDFSKALPAAHRPVITVSALKYTAQELHPKLETAPDLTMGLVISSKMPYNVAINPLWSDAQLQVTKIERLTKDEAGSLAYVEDKTVSVAMTQDGFRLIRTKESVYPIPGSYRMHLVWDWNGVPLREKTVYFFINTN